MLRMYWEDAMIGRIVTVCLLLAAAGCAARPAKDPRPAKGPMPEPVESRTVEATAEQPAPPATPEETGREAEIADDGPTSIEAEAVEDRTKASPEPNQPKPAGKIDITDLVQHVESAATEPNELSNERAEPAVAPPDVPTDPEPTPPTEPEEVQSETSDPEPTRPEPKEPNVLTAFYDKYAAILKEYVRSDGRVDYAPLRRKRLVLKHLLAIPDALDPNVYQAWSRDEKLAFWINTYNLKMLDVIARNYPIESSMWLRLTWPPNDIRHIKGIWSDHRFIVMDEAFTLGEVDRRIFRRTFGDPRVYLALTYATRSSPSLRRAPYRGEDLDRQLDEQVKAFLADETAFKIDALDGVVYLSALFKPSWRGKEFVARYGTDKKFKRYDAETRAVLNFLTRYVSTDSVHFLEVENYTLKYVNFDWCLNDTSRGY